MSLDQRELEILAARMVLGLMDREEIYSLADQATTQGDDNPDLIRIIVEGPNAPREVIAPILASYLLSFGVLIPRPEDAQVELAYRYAKRAIDRQTEAIDAAFLIDRDCLRRLGDAGPDGILTGFSYLAGEYGFAQFERNSRAIEARCEKDAHDLCLALISDFESGDRAKWRWP